MKVREEELARFYAAAAEDVRNATLSSTEGLIWTKKVREVLKCADLIPNLYYGRDPSELVQLAETRAPQLHDTILAFVFDGAPVVRSEYERAKQLHAEVRRETLKVEQAKLRISAMEAAVEHDKVMLQKKQDYIELENRRLHDEIRVLRLGEGLPSERSLDDILQDLDERDP